MAYHSFTSVFYILFIYQGGNLETKGWYSSGEPVVRTPSRTEEKHSVFWDLDWFSLFPFHSTSNIPASSSHIPTIKTCTWAIIPICKSPFKPHFDFLSYNASQKIMRLSEGKGDVCFWDLTCNWEALLRVFFKKWEIIFSDPFWMKACIITKLAEVIWNAKEPSDFVRWYLW